MWTLTLCSLVFVVGASSSASEFTISTETYPLTSENADIINVTLEEPDSPTRELPPELWNIRMPADYDKENYNKSLPDPLIGFIITLSNITMLEKLQKFNVSLQVNVQWTDARLELAPNSNISKWFTSAPPAALDHFWQPRPWTWGSDSRDSSFDYDITKNKTSQLFWKLGNRTECMGCVRFSREYKVTVLLFANMDINYKFFPNDKYFARISLEAGRYYYSSYTYIPVRHPRVHIWNVAYRSDKSFDIRVASTAFTESLRNDSLKYFDFLILYNRRIESYIYKIYIPSGLFVVLSWLSMLLPAETAAERVALCATTLLTLTVFYNQAGETGESVSYLRALDIWLLGCIAFVFLILFESIVILRIAAIKIKKVKLKDSGTGDIKQALYSISMHFEQMQTHLGGADPERKTITPPSSTQDKDLESKVKAPQEQEDEPRHYYGSAKVAEMIDRLSLIAFLIILAGCNGIYWNWLLNTVQQTCDWDDQCRERLIDTEEFKAATRNMTESP